MTAEELIKLAEEAIYADSGINPYTRKDRYLMDYGRGLKGLGDRDLMMLLDEGRFNTPSYDYDVRELPEMRKFDKNYQIRNLLETIAFNRGAVSTDEGTYIPPIPGNQFTGAGPGRFGGIPTTEGEICYQTLIIYIHLFDKESLSLIILEVNYLHINYVRWIILLIYLLKLVMKMLIQ